MKFNRFASPVPLAPCRFRKITPHGARMQRLQHLAAVITLVCDQFFHSQRMNLPRYRLRFRQRFMQRVFLAFRAGMTEWFWRREERGEESL
jgi:hypothetical protein